jgi:D-alanyl-D-alanine carboxypeptidase/D-alanyl-D-alanine-endopeptidase (penicillin-binding protein 4)
VLVPTLVALSLWLTQSAGLAKKAAPRAPRALGPHINYILRQSSAQRGFWGIEVVRLRDGRVLFKQNADHLFMPASNMKLFTTAAALGKLGPEFIFRTTVETDVAPDSRGRVNNLVLVGRGDANIGSRVVPYNLKTERKSPADEVLRELADQVAARGVREVGGNLVADDSYFLFEPYGHDWAAEDLQWGYAAPVTALAFNDNALFLHVQPATTAGQPAMVSLDPISDYYRLNNRLETTAAADTKHVYVERAPGSMELDVWGEVPLGSIIDDDTVSIENPPQLIADLFLKLLEARGIKVRGRVVVRHLSRMDAAETSNPFPAPAPRALLAEHDSLPLREDIRVINKVSQNLHAEMLLRTLAHEAKNYGSLTVGLEVLRDFATQARISADQFYFADGSGLSRKALVAPEAVVKLLEYMARSPHFNAFYDSLPVAGVDGTLAERFAGSPAEGHIHAKTGTITHVNALSGYMDLPNGDRLAFSLFGNADLLEAHDAVKVVDEIALAIYEKFGGRRDVARRKTAKN